MHARACSVCVYACAHTHACPYACTFCMCICLCPRVRSLARTHTLTHSLTHSHAHVSWRKNNGRDYLKTRSSASVSTIIECRNRKSFFRPLVFPRTHTLTRVHTQRLTHAHTHSHILAPNTSNCFRPLVSRTHVHLLARVHTLNHARTLANTQPMRTCPRIHVPTHECTHRQTLKTVLHTLHMHTHR